MIASSPKTSAYGNNAKQVLDLYRPSRVSRHPERAETAIVFWHGGSWRSGKKETYRFVGRSLSRLGYTVVIPNYRLYPEVTFPAFIEDAALATKWTEDNLSPKRIILAGHSAGAHIAAILAADEHYLRDAEVTRNAVAGFIGLAGPYDFTPHPTLAPAFVNTPAADRNPVDLVTGPAIPILLFNGRRDHIVEYTNSSALAQAIQAKGGQATAISYRFLGHFTILIGLATYFLLLPSMKRQITRFIDALDMARD